MARIYNMIDQMGNNVLVTHDEDGTFSFTVTLRRSYLEDDVPQVLKSMGWRHRESVCEAQPVPLLRLVK